jgi:NADH-quinone oxidoreductase subunit A
MAARLFGDAAYMLTFATLGVVFVVAVLAISRVLQPHHPNPAKLATYECGKVPIGEAWVHFNIRYYVVGLVFVIFDIEAAFLFPWAVAFRGLGGFGLLEMAVFIGVLLVGLAFAWRRGALEWL